MTYRGRFAPSPTGPLHFGSLVAALASWLDARASGGEWRVRIEDVDGPRTVPGADTQILRTLEKLGLHWDGEVTYQSSRLDRYDAALDRLREARHTYRCRCSRREIADSAMQGIEGAIYPGTCRHRELPASEPAAERVIAPEDTIHFVDRVQGTLSQNVAHEIGDFVLKRRDGLHSYQLAVVVDDAEAGITDVVRGADLLWSTPRQIGLQRSIGLPTPRYLHIPVAADRSGEKLSKQTLAPPIHVGNAGEELRRALRFLGQRVEDDASVVQMLEVARKRWDPGLIPRRSAIAVP
jgi:glutamyl-queuosine tRNA(Asp) synthetase